MTDEALINELITVYDQVSPVDGDYSARRARILSWAQDITDEVCFYRQWTFLMSSAEVNVSSTTLAGDLPADFSYIPETGGVFRSDDGQQMTERPVQEILRLQLLGVPVATLPDMYAIYGYNSTTKRKLIQVPPISANVNVEVNYLKIPPTLSDPGTGLKDNIPEQYHRTVIMQGTLYRMLRAKGAMASGDYFQKYRENLATMAAREIPFRSEVRRMPMANRQW
jgi:hypothetical protein